MSLKEQYITDIGSQVGADIPYQNDPIRRVKRLFQTARQANPGPQFAEAVWQCLSPLLETQIIPSTQNDYSLFAKERIRRVCEVIAGDHHLRLGVAQKVFNLFIKDLWAWDTLTFEQEKVLHFPLDRTILHLLRNNPWPTWTQVVANDENYNTKFEEYLGIQNVLRVQLNNFSFETPLELEQYLWHRFE